MKLSSHNATSPTPLQKHTYTYTPLPNPHTCNRLLRLHPSPDPTSQLQCSLFTTPLTEAPPYTALSYCWGDTTRSLPISISSSPVSVTPNLQHALTRLRKRDQEVVLWVDAICINQEDLAERGVQTGNMRGIYQAAEKVAVWLGLEDNKSSTAIAFARELSACHDEEEIKSKVRNARKEELEALVVSFRRQYWWRMWVIQEVSCARETVVYCGDDEIRWGELDGVCDVFKGEEEWLRSVFYSRPSYVWTLLHGGPRSLQLSRYSPELEAPPLLELLLSHKSKKSTDPRDKVYALVGICSTRDTFGEIDYGREMREIYTHTARHIISTEGKLDVICVKQHDMGQFNLPSWVPDWTRPPPNGGALVVGLQHHKPEFAAAGNSVAEFKFMDGGYVLQASGFVLDSITSVGMPFKKKGAPKDIEPALHVFHDWWNLFAASFPDSDSVSAQATFGKAISCGNWMFDDENVYEQRLRSSFELSDSMLVDEDVLRIDTPPHTSLSGSVSSLVEDNAEMDDDVVDDKEQRAVIINAALTMNRRRLFISRAGVVGLAPWNTAVGDVVCVLLGCRFPVVLRPRQGRYTLVGEAYVDGFMNGEAMAVLDDEKVKLETFQIR